MISSNTIQFPLSAFLMVRFVFLLREWRLLSPCLERLGYEGDKGRVERKVLVRVMYCSSLGLEDEGWIKSDLEGPGESLKIRQ